MSDTIVWLYLLLQLDSIKHFLNGLESFFTLLASGALIFIFLILAHAEKISTFYTYKWYIITPLLLSIMFGFIDAVLPSTNRAAAMVIGATVIDSNATKIISNLPEKYAKILDTKADIFLKETLDKAK